MIPADHFRVNGDGTAWLVAIIPGWGNGRPDGGWIAADRPCDTCGGGLDEAFQWRDWQHVRTVQDCGDCDGTGRHTFEVETTAPNYLADDCAEPVRTLRVHVIDVREIVPGGQSRNHEAPHVATVLPRPMGVLMPEDSTITLPSAAEPGMRLVRLAVHQ